MPVTTLAKPSSPLFNEDHTILTRQDAKPQDLGSALGDLLDLLKSLSGLLNAEFFGDVEITVHGLADLLAPPAANQTRALISRAGGLLDELSPLIDTILDIDLDGLVKSLGGLLTPDTIKTVAALLKRVDGLLSQEFINLVKGLIEDVAPVSQVIVSQKKSAKLTFLQLISAVSEFITALISALIGG